MSPKKDCLTIFMFLFSYSILLSILFYIYSLLFVNLNLRLTENLTVLFTLMLQNHFMFPFNALKNPCEIQYVHFFKHHMKKVTDRAFHQYLAEIASGPLLEPRCESD